MSTSVLEQSGDFTLYNYAENFILARPSSSTRAITMTGSEVTKRLPIPYSHRLVKILFRHVIAAGTDAVSPLDIEIRRDSGQISDNITLKEILINQSDMIDANLTMTFGEGFEYEPTIWTISLNGTNTDIVYIQIYLQRLGRNANR